MIWVLLLACSKYDMYKLVRMCARTYALDEDDLGVVIGV